MDISPQADGALSSEDGSGLHTPTSAYTKLPPININTSFQPFDQDQPHSFPHRHHLDNPYHSAYLAEPTPLLQPQHTQPCLPSFPSLSPSFTFPPFVVPGALPMYSQYDQSAQLPPIQSSNYAHQSSQQASLPPLAPPPAPLPPVQSSSNPVIVAKREPSPSPPPATTPMPVASTEPGSVRADSGPDPGPSSSTAQKAPSRVKDASGQVIACKQCRARKIRCDSTRPVCNNCTRRCNTCEYDPVPKRRGPDKRPGTRQRSCKKKPAEVVSPKRRRPSEPAEDTPTRKQSKTDQSLSLRISEPIPPQMHATQSPSLVSPTPMSLYSPATPSHAHQVQMPPSEQPGNWPDPRAGKTSRDFHSFQAPTSNQYFNARPDEKNVTGVNDLGRIPIDYSPKSWWESLLTTYSSDRERSFQAIRDDLSFLFNSTSYWLACFNVPIFFQTLEDPVERQNMQPALVLAGLALATLMRSSEIGLGQSGRLQALELRNAAQASLQSSYESGWIDTTLAQAALILALFEASAHPDHTAERAATSLLYLDWIIKRLNLTRLDEHDPETSTFTQTAVPVVPRQSPIPGQANCGCTPSYRLPSGDISTSPIWNCAPDWDPRWSLADVRREESRRLCWSALTLVAAHTADCAAFGRKPLDLELIKPSNYALLFPGEILSRTQPAPLHPPKESVWALYSRSMLLWISCIEQSRAETSDGEKAEFAMQAWMEASVIEDALNFHACHIEQASLFVGRDYIFNTRMTITQEFRRFVPLPDNVSMFSRKKAIDWLKYQIGVANRVKATLNVLTEGQTQILSNRPFYVWWFMGQIAISLSLWSFDNSLTQALELCHAFLKPVDILTALWPCAVQRARYADLRAKLTDACVAAGMTPPLPADFVAPLSTSL